MPALHHLTLPPQLTCLRSCRQVDADKHREIGNRFDVKGFPTILYFARGKPVESHQPCVLPRFDTASRGSTAAPLPKILPLRLPWRALFSQMNC